MGDGDNYQVCCTCGTEFLQRTMREAARDLWQCARCWDLDHRRPGEEDEPDDSGIFYDDEPPEEVM